MEQWNGTRNADTGSVTSAVNTLICLLKKESGQHEVRLRGCEY